MTNRCLCSTSTILPWCQNNNLLVRYMNINEKHLPISITKKYIEQMQYVREPIISVQEQRQTREPISIGIQCKSNYTDKCYAEYNISSLQRGFGQLKDIQYETMEPGKPSLVVNTSALDKNENDIIIATNQVIQELANTELRKRFAIVHTETYIYVVGGYIFDHRIPARRKPLHDYKYDISTHKFIPIPPLPNGAIGFGLCVDENFIYAVGGNDSDNRPFSDCYGLTLTNSNEKWIKLPSLPAPTTGPGVGVYNGEIHCVGGYDILGSESVAHGEYLILRYPHDKQWRYGPELDVTRARPLVLIVPDDSTTGQNVYAAGGFNVNRNTRKPYVIPDLQLLNPTKQRWQRLTIIPDLNLTHALSFSDNKLYVSETIELPDRLPETKILRSFDLRNLTWTDGNDDREKKRINESNSTSGTKQSTLKLPNATSQQNNIKSDPVMDQHLIVPKRIPKKMNRSNTSTPNSPHPSSSSSKKPISTSKRSKMKTSK